MSTNSIIGRKEDGRGRYCHWDGGCSTMGIDLITIFKRDGIEEAMTKIVDEVYGWSTINPETAYDGLPEEEYLQDGRFMNHAGYGMGYTTVEGQSDPDEWYEFGDQEFSYAVDAENETITVYNGRHVIGVVDIFSDTAEDDMYDLDPYNE